jgi:hypothetical protein
MPNLIEQLAGALQAAIYNNLDGHSGLAGWRWMFVSTSPAWLHVTLTVDHRRSNHNGIRHRRFLAHP